MRCLEGRSELGTVSHQAPDIAIPASVPHTTPRGFFYTLVIPHQRGRDALHRRSDDSDQASLLKAPPKAARAWSPPRPTHRRGRRLPTRRRGYHLWHLSARRCPDLSHACRWCAAILPSQLALSRLLQVSRQWHQSQALSALRSCTPAIAGLFDPRLLHV